MIDRVEDLAERVRAERLRRGLSMRTASAAGQVSNTTWGAFENGSAKLGDSMRRAVATAFSWPIDWPERTPVAYRQDEDVILSRLDEIRSELAELTRLVLRVADLALAPDDDELLPSGETRTAQ